MYLVFLAVCGHLLCSIGAAEQPKSLIDTMKHDIFVVTEKTFDSVVSTYRAKGVAAVGFYKSLEESSKKFIDGIFDKVGTELNGMAKIAGINCDEWSTFCESQGVTKFPSIVVYPPHPFPQTLYTGPMKKEDIVSTITRHIPGDNITNITEAKGNVDTFLTTSVAVPKVLLFSEKPNPPVMYKALSNSLNDRMSFAFIQSTDSNLVKKFNIKKFPTVAVIKGELTQKKSPEIYAGALKFAPLHEWLNARSETFVKGGGYSAQQTEEESKPWLVQDIPEMTKASHQDICFRHKVLCVIYVNKDDKIEEDTINGLVDISKEYKARRSDRTATFMFSWLDATTEKGFVEAVGGTTNLPSLIIFNPHKRLRYVRLPDNIKPTRDEIRNLMEKILGGDARFTNVKGQELPPFAQRAPPTQSKKEEL